MSIDIFESLGIKSIDEGGLRSEVTDILPLNLLPLDNALGIGGLPRGRMTAVMGLPSTGKSSLAAQAIVNNQKVGGITLVIDTEFAYEPERLLQFGVDVKDPKLAILQSHYDPKTKVESPLTIEKLEKIFKTAMAAVKKDDNFLIIWDTISNTPVEVEVIGDREAEKIIGVHSKLMARLFRIITTPMAVTNTTFLAVVQPKVDPLFGNTSFLGERPIKFHSSIIINLSREAKDEKKMVIKFECTKNKVAPPFKTGKLNYYFVSGYDYISNYPGIDSNQLGYKFNGKSYKRVDSRRALAENAEDIVKLMRTTLIRDIDYKILVEPSTVAVVDDGGDE